MNVKNILSAALASLAIAPIAAFADGGDQLSQQWLASLKSTRSVEEVRAELATQPPLIVGQRYPVDQAGTVSPERSRAEVKAELAKHGAAVVGA